MVVRRSRSSSESSLEARGSRVGGLLCRGPRPPSLDGPAGEDMISSWIRLSFIRVLELVCRVFWRCVAGSGSMVTPSAMSWSQTRSDTGGGGGSRRGGVPTVELMVMRFRHVACLSLFVRHPSSCPPHCSSPTMVSINLLILLACVGVLHGTRPQSTLQNLFLIFAILSSRIFDL